MRLQNETRYLAWKCLDALKRDHVHSRIRLIKKVMEDDNFHQQHQAEKLSEICTYAVQHTEFYKAFQNKNIADFPVINKNVIMDSFNAFKSDEYENAPIHMMATSGSTGRPFKIRQDMGKRNQVLAEIMYFSNLVGYKVGKKLVYLRNLESILTKSKLKQFLQNETVIFTQNYKDENLKKIVAQLRGLENGTTILGYASTLQAISSYMERNDICATNVTGIISGAEAITSKTRALTKKQFGCPVVSRYSNQEMGILAQDSEEDHFILNRADYYFELLQMDSNEPAELGQVGRIVVTDFYNKAMPMIRYDTGDLGIMQKDTNGCPYLAKVMGRKLDLLYNTKNEPLSFFALDEFFEPNYDIEQYQIVQESRTDLTVNIIMKKEKTLDEKWCIAGVKSVMGQDCNVKIEYLDQVPITNSGKFRYVICNYHPDCN